MFHVSTMLPFYPLDKQQVERKRHLGNDIVVIVYLEPGAQFSPSIMTTQFNRKSAHVVSLGCMAYLAPCLSDIYCVVRMDNVDDEIPAVRVEYAAKVLPTITSCLNHTHAACHVGWRASIRTQATNFQTIFAGRCLPRVLLYQT